MPTRGVRPDTAAKMRMIMQSYGEPTPEQEATVLRILEKNDAMDLVPVLGLQVTYSESRNDTKVAV